MAISKFKITQAPKRASIKIEGVDYVLNQEYAIHLQSAMQIFVTNVGEPYDNFGFKLGNPNNVWSPEYIATINALVDIGTPALSPLDINIKQNENTNLLPFIVFDDYTDRFRIIQANSTYGDLVINGSEIVLNKTYMLYDLTSLMFNSNYSGIQQHVISPITINVGNKSGYSGNVVINLISTANMVGNIDTSTSVITI